MHEIEKNIPIPYSVNNLLENMEVGDSFLSDRSRSTLSSAISIYVKKNKHKKFKTGMYEGLVRVWRIK